VIGDDGFERAFLAHERGIFAAQRIEMTLGIGLGGALDFQLIARAGDLCAEGRDTLRSGFKFQSQLTALAAEAFQLLMRGGGFVVQTLRVAIEGGDALFGLGDAIAHGRSRGDGLQNCVATLFLLTLHFDERC
jgi:hypothetical protein